MTVTMLITFGSTFLTDVFGVHAIFGTFILPTSYMCVICWFQFFVQGAVIAGLIVPREGGFAIMITEKVGGYSLEHFLPLVGYSMTSESYG